MEEEQEPGLPEGETHFMQRLREAQRLGVWLGKRSILVFGIIVAVVDYLRCGEPGDAFLGFATGTLIGFFPGFALGVLIGLLRGRPRREADADISV